MVTATIVLVRAQFGEIEVARLADFFDRPIVLPPMQKWHCTMAMMESVYCSGGKANELL